MHLGSAPRIPCPLRRFVPALFPAADAGCAILGYPCWTDESLLWYSYATASLLVAVFSALRFSRIPAAQALCADVDNPLPSMVYLHGRRSFEAARNDAALASVPSCRSTHICRLSPSTYCRAALVPPAVSFLHVFFLRSGSSVMAFVKNMVTCVE